MAHTESTEATAGTESAESPMHEGSTISLRALIRFVVVFVAALIVVHLLIWGVFVVFRAAVGQERQITGVEAAHLPPPEPRLQPSVEHNQLPAQDLEQLRRTEREEFDRRGWVDEETGKVRVPDDIANRLAQMSRPR